MERTLKQLAYEARALAQLAEFLNECPEPLRGRMIAFFNRYAAVYLPELQRLVKELNDGSAWDDRDADEGRA